MQINRLIPLLFAVFLGVSSSVVEADIVLSGTGREIAEHNMGALLVRAHLPFENELDERLRFDPGGSEQEVVLSFPVFAAGTLESSAAIVVSYEFELTRSEPDYEPAFGLVAGDDAHLIIYSNNSGGQISVAEAVIENESVSSIGTIQNIVDNTGFPDVGDPLVVFGSFEVTLAGGEVFAEMGTAAEAVTVSGLNPSKELRLVVLQGSASQSLTIETAHVEGGSETAAVPEPTGIWFGGLACLLSFSIRRCGGLLLELRNDPNNLVSRFG